MEFLWLPLHAPSQHCWPDRERGSRVFLKIDSISIFLQLISFLQVLGIAHAFLAVVFGCSGHGDYRTGEPRCFQCPQLPEQHADAEHGITAFLDVFQSRRIFLRVVGVFPCKCIV